MYDPCYCLTTAESKWRKWLNTNIRSPDHHKARTVTRAVTALSRDSWWTIYMLSPSFPFTFRVYVIGGNKVVFVSLISLQAFKSHSESFLQDDYIRPSNMTICFHRRTRKINILEFWSRDTEVGIDIRRWARVPSFRIPDKAKNFLSSLTVRTGCGTRLHCTRRIPGFSFGANL